MKTEVRSQKPEVRQKLIRLFSRHSVYHLSYVLCLMFSVFCILSSVSGADNRQPLQFGKKPEIRQVKPKKPVKIKLHRNAGGEYTWDLTGDSVDEIVRADDRLKKLLKLE